MTAEVALRPLQAEDFDLLYHWMNAPHLVPFYMRDPISRDDVTAKFTPRLGPDHLTKCMIAETAGQPFGYLQWYLNRSFPDWGIDTIGQPDGISIDYYIGETAFLGRRLGAAMLSSLVDHALSTQPAVDQIAFVGHDRRNERAIRCTLLAGFQRTGLFMDGGKPSILFRKGLAAPGA